MCILCDTNDEIGDAFLVEFGHAQVHIEKACAQMLACSKTAKTPEAARRYDRTHKRMVKILCDWNRIEQERERDALPGA